MSTVEVAAGEAAHPVVWADILAQEQDGDDALSGYERAVAALVPQLEAILLGPRSTMKLEAYLPRVQSPPQWREDTAGAAVVIEFLSDDQDNVCALLAMRAELVGGSLAIYLGSSAPLESLSRPAELTGMERRYVERIAPAIMEAIQPLSNKPLLTHRVCEASGWHTSQSHPMCVSSLALAPELAPGLLSIAVPCHLLADSSDKLDRATMPVYAADQAKILELGRAKVKLDIIVQAAALTLERIRSLGPGDVIAMASVGLNEARAVAKGHSVFVGQVGRTGTAFSIRVSQTCAIRAKAAISAPLKKNGLVTVK